MRQYVCVSVLVSAPKGINNQLHDMVWYTYVGYWLNKFHGFSPLLITLYDTCHR